MIACAVSAHRIAVGALGVPWRPSAGAGHRARHFADRSHRQLGVDRHGRLALPHGDAARRATTRACRSTPRRAPSRTRGIRRRTKPPATRASRTARRNIMRVPGRLHISWQDDTTLKIETDAGSRRGCCTSRARRAAIRAGRATRRRRGKSPAAAAAAAAGAAALAVAAVVVARRRGRGAAASAARRLAQGRHDAAEGRLPAQERRARTARTRRSPNISIATPKANGDEWFTVTTIVDDPKYLAQTFITSTHFKKEADASKWYPSPCKAS